MCGVGKGRDVAQAYIDTPARSLSDHKFLEFTQGSPEFKAFPTKGRRASLKYLLEIFVDHYISLAVRISSAQLDHVANSGMHGVHKVFQAEAGKDTDPIIRKKLKKGDER